MAQYDQIASVGRQSTLATNKVLKNTYMLLSMTLVFSAVTALVAMAVGISPMVSMIMMFSAIGIIWFVLPRTYESSMGIVWTFVFTGLLGASLGPMLTYYLAMPSGPAIVAQALGGTAIVTFALSFYALATKKDFSFLMGFLMVGMVVIVAAIIANIFLSIPALSIAISAAVVLIMSLMILFDTSRIVNGGETNYIRATTNLYMDIYNLFIHLLSLVAALTGND
ncbi:Bax inhibitor-1/YccA family protein [Reinekea marinisedimentorum]|uniref:Modulator of FtsH protease n=1 Tax=Reinekea marinisedimentorum TaxID=230495 RepID=A0A4V2UK22_9GAMM|nr:Bax inhibitor-1/YccA family protein [Reinekea marinisedimentorum]TCS42496.1 modulator of FtsH protease [Reinekea marinisedimentorum]